MARVEPAPSRVRESTSRPRLSQPVQAIVVLLAAAVVGCNFLADLLYRVMDPRIERT